MKHLLLFCLLIAGLSLTAQVRFQEIDLDGALKQAASNGKIVFAQFVSATCEQCNEVADKAFSNLQLGNIVQEKCIAIKVETDAFFRGEFIEKYNTEESIGSFFITADGDLIHRTKITSSNPKTYITDIETAYGKFVEGRLPLKELDNLWAVTNNDFALMEMNLRRRTELQLPMDSLLEVYVSKLPKDSLASIRVLQFIAKQAPLLTSNASLLLRNDTTLFNRAWYDMQLKERVNINNRIILKTRKQAIALKSLNIALKAANFARAVQEERPSSNAGRRAFDFQMLSYFRGVTDTAKLLVTTVAYCDNYYMKVPAKDVIKYDSIYRAKLLEKAKADTVRSSSGTMDIRKSVMVSLSPFAQDYCNTLSHCADEIFNYSNEKTFLEKALVYAEKGVAICENPEAINIYAKLLYVNSRAAEAIEWEQKAIDILQKRQYTANRFIKVLQKMKAGENLK